MKVFKFGGASVKDAQGFKNLAKIIKEYKGDDALLVVISAVGKTTNALEEVWQAYLDNQDWNSLLEKVIQSHQVISNELFGNKPAVTEEIDNAWLEISWMLEDQPVEDVDYIYDQVVSVGEIISSKILAHYLTQEGFGAQWLDARDYIKTDNTYRDAKLDWTLTESLISNGLKNKPNTFLGVTQGFIGCTSENYTTTLGRDGSDYSAGIFAFCTDAKDVTIWKDVPGMLNADPKWFDDTELLHNLTFIDAIELAYYGANVIHPKTIKPLQNKEIPLYIKSFLEPSAAGTKISGHSATEPLIPSFIFKMNQDLISISARDFSFIVEENLKEIFDMFARHRVKVNLMQNTAISFSVCCDHKGSSFQALIEDLKTKFTVRFNRGLELATIRHYSQSTIDRVTANKKIILEIKSRHTIQMVMMDR